jgi:hypothetical protein
MSHLRQAYGWLAAGLMAGRFAVGTLPAQTPPPFPPMPGWAAAPTNRMPPMPRAKSPVDSFRELLAMNPAERERTLTNRPTANRARILAKLREYAALDPNERELRLRATELRWYLLPLLHQAPANRGALWAAVPDDLRPLVQSRLQQWDILPPGLQQEFFESERTLRYFARVEPTNRSPLPPLPPGMDPERANAFTADRRQKMSAQFSQFFELTPAEKKKTLSTLSEVERQQMERTLDAFGRLSPRQRQKCIRAFAEFAGMTTAEKQEFLGNAQRWSQMSPQERQAWRDLVTHVPEWPPLPPELLPPLPPASPQVTRHTQPLVATNPN